MARFDYQTMTVEALRGVVRQVLSEVAAEGLEGEHHFYIGLRTDHPEVQIPQPLKDLHPEQMTIVLQHQFWDLYVDDEAFSVTLAFGGRRQRLYVPFAAIETFADPAAELALRFDLPAKSEDAGASGPADETGGPETEGGSVVRMDRFRPKPE